MLFRSQDATIHRTEFRDCKIMGLDLTGATLRNLLMRDCMGDYSTYRFTNMKQVSFLDCSLCGADFYSSELQQVHFDGSNLDQVQLSGTKLEGIDLSVCEFTELAVTIADLQGCIIGREQASVFAGLFGLVLKHHLSDEDEA